MNELEMLRREVASLVANLSPFIGQEKMQARYNVTGTVSRFWHGGLRIIPRNPPISP